MYAFVSNRPLTLFDALGLTTGTADLSAGSGGASAVGANSGSQAITYLNQVREMVDKFNDIQEIASIAMDMFQASDEVFAMLMQAGRNTLAEGPSGRMGRKNHSIPKFMTGEASQKSHRVRWGQT